MTETPRWTAAQALERIAAIAGHYKDEPKNQLRTSMQVVLAEATQPLREEETLEVLRQTQHDLAWFELDLREEEYEWEHKHTVALHQMVRRLELFFEKFDSQHPA